MPLILLGSMSFWSIRIRVVAQPRQQAWPDNLMSSLMARPQAYQARLDSLLFGLGLAQAYPA
jgi:hypothetical protein